MSTPICFARRALRLCRVTPVALIAVTAFAAKPAWKPVTPAELAETEPTLEKEAAAEALFVIHELDDNNFPRERRTTEYIRYKIFVPERAESLMRISGIDNAALDNRVELRARLVLPDGRTQEFGTESIKERVLSKQGKEGGLLGWLSDSGAVVKEKFLAVSGVEPGAVLEYQVTRRTPYPPHASAYTAQRESIPIRQLTYMAKPCPDTHEWGHRTFVLNSKGAKLVEDPKSRRITITATNLPSVLREPFVGPRTDYSLTVVNAYQLYDRLLLPRSDKVPVPGTIDVKLGPWTPYATLTNWYERDRGYVTPRVKAVAAEITATATSDHGKALAIHRYVQDLYQQHRRRPGPRPEERKQPTSLDDILDVEKKPEVIRFTDEFVWLAVALYRSAGLECNTILLPDRRFARFSPQNVSTAFLPHKAVALRLGGEWVFSAPQTLNRVPLGILPWEQEAQVGLLALERKTEFIKVPATPAEKSVIAVQGKFKVDPDGTLTGECTRSFTGQTAVELRGELRKNQKTRRDEIARGKLGFDPKVVEITVLRIEALDDAEKPLRIAARIKWPDFATRTKDRLVLRPSVFRVDATAPFTATERRHPVHFPYRWQEQDRVEIQLPPGFVPESPSAPPSSPGEVMSYAQKLSWDPARRVLHATREFTSRPLDLSPDYYPSLKGWYDGVARADQHEIVFNQRTAPAKSAGD